MFENMNHPFFWINPDRQGKAFFICAILALLMFGVLGILGKPLKVETAPYGILSYEFAGDTHTAEEI